MSTRTRKDLILWGALGCALVLSAHAEYTLATATGVNKYVALAVPGALDLYVIRALLSRREVLFAVLVMVAANVTSHLITAGVLGVQWPTIAAVGALAPVLLWRIYALKYASAPVLGAPGEVSTPEAGGLPVWVPGYHLDGCDGVHALEGPVNCVTRASALECATPDRIPEWMHDEYPASAPEPCTLSEPFLRPLDARCSECGGLWGDHPGVQAKRAAHALKYPYSVIAPLHSVPDLPPEYVTSAEPLNAYDWEYLPSAREYRHSTEKPSVRGLMKHAKVGQDRAGRLLDYLEDEAAKEGKP